MGAEGERKRRVVLAEDDDELRELLADKLEQQGVEVVRCKHGLELVMALDGAFGLDPTIQGARGENVDLVLTDIRMPGVTGMSVLEGLNASDRNCPIILMTAFGDDETHASAQRLGAEALFDKPFDVQELLGCVERALRR